ncbi:hypothetical protein [Dyella thiooxydans]|uniref:hypothetical protein n=1 Tax=Dyella thiooxydans TaxID=445710 RepID=UPI0012F82CD0|nr:hypothetical protein [Dyella thiooxydans]
MGGSTDICLSRAAQRLCDKGWQVAQGIRKSAWWREPRPAFARFVAALICASRHVFDGPVDVRNDAGRILDFAIGLTSDVSVERPFGRKKRGID